MLYCPICKTEYPEDDITVCPECNVGLIVGERNDKVPVFSLQKEDSAQRFVEFASEQGIEVTYEYMIREDAYKIYVDKKDMKVALKLFATYHMQEVKRKKAAEEEVLATAAANDTITAPEEPVSDIPPENVSIVASDLPEEPVKDDSDAFLRQSPFDEQIPEETYTEDIELTVDLPEVNEPELAATDTSEPILLDTDMSEPVIEETTVSEPVLNVTSYAPIEEVTQEPVSKPIFVEVERVEESTLDEASVIDPSFIEFTPVNENKTKIDFDDEVVDPKPAEPVAIESAPVIEKVAPVIEEATPVVEETAPVIEEVAPVVESAPILEEAAPVIDIPETEPKAPTVADSATPEEDAFSDFLSNFKKASISKTQKQPDPIVEDIAPKADIDDGEYHSISSRPTDISDTPIKYSEDSLISEEVLDGTQTAPEIDITEVVKANEQTTSETVKESVPVQEPSAATEPAKPVEKKTMPSVPMGKPPIKPVSKATDMVDDLDDNYAGFVPDYSYEESTERELTAEEKAMEEFKKRAKERHFEAMQVAAAKQKEQARQANLVKELGNGQKIVFEDTDELDNYAGFVPDYTPNTNNEAEFDFYKPHSIGSYAKYKKSKNKDTASVSNTYMRQTNAEEMQSIFISHIPTNVKRTINSNDIKGGNFLVSMSGPQLTKLFNCWMMMNITAQTVRQYESLDATPQENVERKLAGMKNQLKDNFGDLNDGFLDAIVARYYSKYLED